MHLEPLDLTIKLATSFIIPRRLRDRRRARDCNSVKLQGFGLHV